MCQSPPCIKCVSFLFDRYFIKIKCDEIMTFYLLDYTPVIKLYMILIGRAST